MPSDLTVGLITKKLFLAGALWLACLSCWGQITNGLVSHWPLDGPVAGVWPDTFGSNSLTASGGVSVVAGVVGNAAQFDGIDGILQVASNASLQTGATDWSIFLFVRDDNPGGMGVWIPVLSKADDGGWIQSEYDFSLNQTNPQQIPPEFLFASVYYYNATYDYVNQYAAVDSIATVDASPIWRAVLITHNYANQTFTIRVDSNAPITVSTGVDSDAPQVSDAPFRIGSSHVEGFGDFFGKISVDDVWFWKRAVSDAEYQDLKSGVASQSLRVKRGKEHRR